MVILLRQCAILNGRVFVNDLVYLLLLDYDVKIAETLEEACKLLQVGFEYVTDMDGKKLFRKRK